MRARPTQPRQGLQADDPDQVDRLLSRARRRRDEAATGGHPSEGAAHGSPQAAAPAQGGGQVVSNRGGGLQRPIYERAHAKKTLRQSVLSFEELFTDI